VRGVVLLLLSEVNQIPSLPPKFFCRFSRGNVPISCPRPNVSLRLQSSFHSSRMLFLRLDRGPCSLFIGLPLPDCLVFSLKKIVRNGLFVRLRFYSPWRVFSSADRAQERLTLAIQRSLVVPRHTPLCCCARLFFPDCWPSTLSRSHRHMDVLHVSLVSLPTPKTPAPSRSGFSPFPGLDFSGR